LSNRGASYYGRGVSDSPSPPAVFLAAAVAILFFPLPGFCGKNQWRTGLLYTCDLTLPVFSPCVIITGGIKNVFAKDAHPWPEKLPQSSAWFILQLLSILTVNADYSMLPANVVNPHLCRLQSTSSAG
jgi:hypothetical protein